MTKHEKELFEEKRVRNYFIGIIASLLNDVIILCGIIAIIFGMIRVETFTQYDFFNTENIWIIYMLVMIIALLVLLKSPWRKYKRRAIEYYRGLSDDLSYNEWFERLLKRFPKSNVVECDGYIDIYTNKSNQLTILKDIRIMANVITQKKNHVIIVYSTGNYDESVFEFNGPRKRVVVYIPSEKYTYSKQFKESIEIKSILSWLAFHNLYSINSGFRKVKFSHIPELIIVWLFRMY